MSEEEIERRLIASLQEDKLSLADIQSFLIDKRLWFRTVLPDLNYKKESLKDNVPQNDLEKIIKSIKENPRITREELAAIIGKSVKTVAKIIKDSKLIHFLGSSRSGHWEVVEYKKDN